MTTAEKLNTIHSACSDIKQAIIDKGQTPSGGISTYADAIENLSSGGGLLESVMADMVAGNNPVDITDLQAAETSINAFLSI